MRAHILSYAGGMYTFRVYETADRWRDIAVSDIEARTSVLADQVLQADADEEARARYVAEVKANCLRAEEARNARR
jgi:hypothetical protein